jgi:DNA repair protein RadB
MRKIETGTEVMDSLLNNGYDSDIITTIYGPAGSGKTCVCMLCAANIARSGKKVVYIDTEGGFSVERLKQVAPDYEKVLKNMSFFKPLSFEGQKKVFDGLRKIINDKTGLVVVDTIAMLYRLEMGKTEDVYGVNKELGLQLSYIGEVARKKDIPVLIANQVYANFEDKNKISMVGGDILKYTSKCLIELQVLANGNRKAILRKHRSIQEGKEAVFKIVENGFEEQKEKKSLFF